jgi:16S rRNA (adenine1518-N6/adenine1519-N6)-dimethyltransferase
MMDDTPHTKKSLGQHWLHDQASLEAMCDSVDVQKGDIVLEIGPGTGTLTEVLLGRGAEVIALEFDKSLIPALQKKFKTYGTQFRIQHGDIRSFDFTTMPPGYKLVANIPYYLTANLMRLLTDEPTYKPSKAALLMQKEVVERIAAKPGDMAFLSAAAQFYYEAEAGMLVPAELFTPPPKVDSQLLILIQRPEPLFPDVDIKVFFRVMKAGFALRRKTLLNSLSSGLHIDRNAVVALCEAAQIDPKLRAQALSLEQWYNLYSVYSLSNS